MDQCATFDSLMVQGMSQDEASATTVARWGEVGGGQIDECQAKRDADREEETQRANVATATVTQEVWHSVLRYKEQQCFIRSGLIQASCIHACI